MAFSFLAGDLLQCKFVCLADDQIALNVRHFVVNSVTGTPTTDQTFADQLSTAFQPIYENLLSVNAEYYGVQLARRVGAIFFPMADSRAAAGPGAIGGDLLPRQTCGLVKLTTGLPGRAERGRMYGPFPSEGSNEPDSTPNAAYIATIQQLGDSVAGPFNIVGPVPELWAVNLTGAIYHRAPNNFTLLTGASARNGWATQRRRGSFGRSNLPPF